MRNSRTQASSKERQLRARIRALEAEVAALRAMKPGGKVRVQYVPCNQQHYPPWCTLPHYPADCNRPHYPVWPTYQIGWLSGVGTALDCTGDKGLVIKR